VGKGSGLIPENSMENLGTSGLGRTTPKERKTIFFLEHCTLYVIACYITNMAHYK